MNASGFLGIANWTSEDAKAVVITTTEVKAVEDTDIRIEPIFDARIICYMRPILVHVVD